ncbi:MAG TPA: nuclear transport factor 2 family protein [Nocardioides sp.]|nr:nuclear transport factor 2 family protein [Nocardioides sp.]
MTSNETLLSDAEIFAATKNCIEAWNTLDLENTLATYTDDVVYQDPGTQGQIHGKADLRRYLTKFLQKWDMRFRVIEDRRIVGADAQVCLWEVDIRLRDGSGAMITQPGMDIIHVRGGQLSRDEAFMDRLPMMQQLI